MTPTLTLDRRLTPAEAGSWLARVAPAVENDLMAGYGSRPEPSTAPRER